MIIAFLGYNFIDLRTHFVGRYYPSQDDLLVNRHGRSTGQSLVRRIIVFLYSQRFLAMAGIELGFSHG